LPPRDRQSKDGHEPWLAPSEDEAGKSQPKLYFEHKVIIQALILPIVDFQQIVNDPIVDRQSIVNGPIADRQYAARDYPVFQTPRAAPRDDRRSFCYNSTQ
jgi:hypothetical protein